LEFPPALNDALINNRILNDMEVNFRLNGKYIRGAISLRPSFGRRYQNSSSIAVIDLTAPDEPLEPIHSKAPTILTAEKLCAESAAMRPVLRQSQVAARAVAPVLIQGQSGTGKNYLARAIHAESSRSDGSLVNINCRAIPSQYIMHEILGGNGKLNGSQPSQFEIAHHGTLLFTHIDSLPRQLQETLLYVIENKQVVRLGETQHIPVDVRIISTTDQNLEHLIAQGKFLPALYYRFKIFHLHLPPLHKRKEDIPLLTSMLLERIADKYGVGSPIYVHEEVMDIFYQYPWPGNIREMETVLEFAYNQRFGQMILVEDLPGFMQEGNITTQTAASSDTEPALTLDEAARKAILRAGWMCEGHVTEMAELLGVSRTTLWRQMKQYNITADYFKS
jgi:transcriptional activator for dhaKLM operon